MGSVSHLGGGIENLIELGPYVQRKSGIAETLAATVYDTRLTI